MTRDDDAQQQRGVTDIPTRRDGTPRAFWYDPEYPGHIMHFTGECVVMKCVGHAH